ncbi:MAG: anti-sigma-F factor Fin [Sporomusaceae bacterium]|nr:anti-sigma-F factor Fin [Sporomusaceae bacterium]
MRLIYICSQCGAEFERLYVRELDESAFGFDSLDAEQRRQLLHFDPQQNSLTVQSLCDRCVEELGLEEEKEAPAARHWLH